MSWVYRPESRDAFIKYQEVFSYQNWIDHHAQTQIRWNGDFASAVHMHPVTGDFQITAAFETTIRAYSNWIVPNLLHNIDFPDHSETGSDAASPQDWRMVS